MRKLICVPVTRICSLGFLVLWVCSDRSWFLLCPVQQWLWQVPLLVTAPRHCSLVYSVLFLVTLFCLCLVASGQREKQRWMLFRGSFLSRHPSVAICVYSAAPVLPVVSVGLGISSRSITRAFGKCQGPCPESHEIIGGSSRGEGPRQYSSRVQPCNALENSLALLVLMAFASGLLLSPELFPSDGKSSSQNSPQEPWQIPFHKRTWEPVSEESCKALDNLSWNCSLADLFLNLFRTCRLLWTLEGIPLVLCATQARFL